MHSAPDDSIREIRAKHRIRVLWSEAVQSVVELSDRRFRGLQSFRHVIPHSLLPTSSCARPSAGLGAIPLDVTAYGDALA